jgi:hypothetical protein
MSPYGRGGELVWRTTAPTLTDAGTWRSYKSWAGVVRGRSVRRVRCTPVSASRGSRRAEAPQVWHEAPQRRVWLATVPRPLSSFRKGPLWSASYMPDESFLDAYLDGVSTAQRPPLRRRQRRELLVRAAPPDNAIALKGCVITPQKRIDGGHAVIERGVIRAVQKAKPAAARVGPAGRAPRASDAVEDVKDRQPRGGQRREFGGRVESRRPPAQEVTVGPADRI